MYAIYTMRPVLIIFQLLRTVGFFLIWRNIGISAVSSSNGQASFYKAAVYEHALVEPTQKAESYEEAVQQMMYNLAVYEEQANIAGSQGVDIIVFPENGIYGYQYPEPSDIAPYLEYIPNPREIDWTPCDDSSRFNRTMIQTFLSCLAKNNSLYLVANYGDAQPCSSMDPNCPSEGQYQYNTNIVFNRDGKLIARYHKQNLFFETQFQSPVNPEMVYFDTEFGRFGTFICFDVLFHDPAIPLVKRYNITDVLFPTAWMDALPFLSAIGFHSAFAVAYRVNFLSANLHLPLKRLQGSGIYTPNGPVDFYYDRNSPNGKLLIGNVPIRDSTNRKGIEFIFGVSELKYLKEHEFKSAVFGDWYNFVALSLKSEKITICQEGLCCYLSYKRNKIIGNYAFGVFNGIHKRNGPYYLQVCILLKCASQDNKSCGRLTFTADGYFQSLKMKGNFSTPYVTPQILHSNNGSLELPALGSMTYDSYGMIGHAKQTPLHQTSLVGRVYESD